jgi:hypothetical protein
MFRAHGSQQLQRKGKTELALVDPVDEHLNVHSGALGLQPAGQLLVGQALLLSEVLHKGLRPRLVELPRVHADSYIVFSLRSSYVSFLVRPLINGFRVMHKTWATRVIDGF